MRDSLAAQQAGKKIVIKISGSEKLDEDGVSIV